MMPSPLDTTAADYLRQQTQNVLQQSQQLGLFVQQVRSQVTLTRGMSCQARHRASEQRVRSRQLRQDLSNARQRIQALLDNQLVIHPPRRSISATRHPAPDKLDNLALIERCKTGERRAWNEMIHRFEPLIFSFARSLAGNATDAADITSEVFVRLFHNLYTFRQGASSFRSWLFRIVHNTYIDVCIRDSNHGHLSLDAPLCTDDPTDSHEVLDIRPTPEILCVDKDEVQRLAEAIRTLPAYQRQVLALFVQGRSYEEIAAKTGLSMGTVKSRLNRARKTLQARLEADERMPDGARLPLRPRRCLS